MKLKNILKKLPLVSALYYQGKGRLEDDEKGVKNSTQALKFLGHLAYGMILVSAMTLYSVTGALTGEWNPLKQPKAYIQGIQQNQIRKQRSDEAYKKLFIKPAYANKDKNKGISFEEKLGAWDRMGLLPDRPVFYDEPFKDPNFKELEKAVESYEAEL